MTTDTGDTSGRALPRTSTTAATGTTAGTGTTPTPAKARPGSLPRLRASPRDRAIMWIVLAITIFVLVAAATIGVAMIHHVDQKKKAAASAVATAGLLTRG